MMKFLQRIIEEKLLKFLENEESKSNESRISCRIPHFQESKSKYFVVKIEQQTKSSI